MQHIEQKSCLRQINCYKKENDEEAVVHAMAEQLMKLLKKDLVVYLSDGNTLKEPTVFQWMEVKRTI